MQDEISSLHHLEGEFEFTFERFPPYLSYFEVYSPNFNMRDLGSFLNYMKTSDGLDWYHCYYWSNGSCVMYIKGLRSLDLEFLRKIVDYIQTLPFRLKEFQSRQLENVGNDIQAKPSTTPIKVIDYELAKKLNPLPFVESTHGDDTSSV